MAGQPGRPIPAPGPGRQRKRLESPVRVTPEATLLPPSPTLKGSSAAAGLPGHSFQPQASPCPASCHIPQSRPYLEEGQRVVIQDCLGGRDNCGEKTCEEDGLGHWPPPLPLQKPGEGPLPVA